ncbi:Bifunctional protein HldE [Streptomyces griseomycini]
MAAAAGHPWSSSATRCSTVTCPAPPTGSPPTPRCRSSSECAERVRPGGAALAAYLAARDGREVTLIAGLGDDPAGRALRELLAPWLTLVPLPLTGTVPEKTRVLAQDRPVSASTAAAAGSAPPRTRPARCCAPPGAVLVSDYGRGAADVLRDELAARPPLVWDPHPRGGPPVPGTRLVTPAEKEAHGFAPAAAATRAGACAPPRTTPPPSYGTGGRPRWR